MSLTEELKGDYKEHARAYNEEYPMLPHGIMETQLLASALGDCTGHTVLDLGGGTGVRAREVIDLGATSVDVVDLSPDMLSAGRRTAEGAGAKYADNIGWHEGDVSKPLSHLPLRQTYDLVMANWVMDHAASLAELEAMWRNVAAYLAPGGRFVGVRSGDPTGGTSREAFFFRYEVATVPPIDIVASSWEVTYSGSTEMMDKVGLGEVETEPYENAEVVKKDLGFWELFLENPSMAVVKARKLARA
ncbi:S-adenosyl-L-methionine-dependent methyltransferase [Daldinia loculata]|nr:S-adenosyl-L-methionine-dependent methyltransferase [Daldinia loculata]